MPFLNFLLAGIYGVGMVASRSSSLRKRLTTTSNLVTRRCFFVTISYQSFYFYPRRPGTDTRSPSAVTEADLPFLSHFFNTHPRARLPTRCDFTWGRRSHHLCACSERFAAERYNLNHGCDDAMCKMFDRPFHPNDKTIHRSCIAPAKKSAERQALDSAQVDFAMKYTIVLHF